MFNTNRSSKRFLGSSLLALLSSTHLSELANCSQGPDGMCPPGGPRPDCNTYPCLMVERLMPRYDGSSGIGARRACN